MTTAWCHGAPGIAISRMAIRRRLGDPDLDHDAHVALAETARAVRQTLPAGGADHCLCHGLSGNADVLLEAARSLPDPDGEWMSLAHEVAERGVERYSNHDRLWPCGLGPGEEPSLMRGLAGVGYYLLRMADPDLPTVLGASGHLTGASARLHTTREAGVHV
jgi:lantibiotic modifying enzyme